MDKDNTKVIIFGLAGLIALNLHFSRIDDRLREITNSMVSKNDYISKIYEGMNSLDLDDNQKDILKKYIESLENPENTQYGLESIEVLTVTNQTGEKKSYLITKSKFDKICDDFSFTTYEKYFDDLPSVYVTCIEMTTYSRISNNSVTPFIFQTKALANDNQSTYQGSYTSINSIFGSSYTRYIWQGAESLLEEYSYEIIDSEFEISIQPLSEVLGTNDSTLIFSIEELSDIEKMINEKNGLSLNLNS